MQVEQNIAFENRSNVYAGKTRLIMALLMITNMQTVYIKIADRPVGILLNILLSGVLFLLLILDGRKYGVTVRRNTLFSILLSQGLLFSILFLQFIFISGINVLSYILIIGLTSPFFILTMLYFQRLENIEIFFFDYVKILTIFAALSLIFYLFGRVFEIIPPSGIISIKWGGLQELRSWFLLAFDAQGSSYGILPYGRNCGIFVESPQYAYALIISLIIQLFVFTKVNNIQLIITLITIFSTYSTTGMILAIGCVYFKYMLLEAKKLTIVFASPLVLITAAFVISLIYIQKTQFAGGSIDVRNANMLRALDLLLESPIFGIGLKSESTGHTSSFTQVIAEGGLLFGVFYFKSFFSAVFKFTLNLHFRMMFFCLIYFLLLFLTVVSYMPLTIAFIAIFHYKSVLANNNLKVQVETFD